jgi:glucose/arabinose dehydrogenase
MDDFTERQAEGFAYWLLAGYRLERVLGGLTFPTSVTCDDRGNVWVVDGGFAYGPTIVPARILRLPGGGAAAAEVVCADGLVGPVTGVLWHAGTLYVAHRQRISVLQPDGTLRDILSGLPSLGDYQNNKLAVGLDGKLYFGQGTATNSGVVGVDNHRYGWLARHPDFCDVPAHDVILTGQNFTTPNPLAPDGPPVTTGAYSPFGLCFDSAGRLYVTEDGPEVRGSRPIGNGAPDNLYEVREGDYFGWPDYYGGLPVSDPRLDPLAEWDPAHPPQPGLLIARPEPLLAGAPPASRQPLARFTPHATPGGFALAREPFGFAGDAFVALFGDISPFASGGLPLRAGHGVARVDMTSGAVHDFLTAIPPEVADASDPHAMDPFRPVDARFDPTGAILYVVDFGAVELTMRDSRVHPGSGALWRIVRESE